MQRILQEITKKNNAWNIRRLVDESFVPSIQSIILKIVRFVITHLLPGLRWTFDPNNTKLDRNTVCIVVGATLIDLEIRNHAEAARLS